MNRKEWIFKMVSITTGRTITKSVVGFDTYAKAEACARRCVPEVFGPVIVLSYM